jgi:hypothetical protein
MTTMPEPARRKTARLRSRFSTAHDGVRTKTASAPVRARQSSLSDPVLLVERQSILTANLHNHRRQPRYSHSASLSDLLKSP